MGRSPKGHESGKERETRGTGEQPGKWTIDFPCHKRAPCSRPLGAVETNRGRGDTSDLLQVPDDGCEIDLCGQRWGHLFHSRDHTHCLHVLTSESGCKNIPSFATPPESPYTSFTGSLYPSSVPFFSVSLFIDRITMN